MADYNLYNFKNNSTSTTGCLGWVVTALVLMILGPVICFWCGYFGGWILMKFVGDYIVNGLNLLFDTARFDKSIIPVVCGTLTIVGNYFKSNTTSSKKS